MSCFPLEATLNLSFFSGDSRVIFKKISLSSNRKKCRYPLIYLHWDPLFCESLIKYTDILELNIVY